jgi:hypothetical protein
LAWVARGAEATVAHVEIGEFGIELRRGDIEPSPRVGWYLRPAGRGIPEGGLLESEEGLSGLPVPVEGLAYPEPPPRGIGIRDPPIPIAPFRVGVLESGPGAGLVREWKTVPGYIVADGFSDGGVVFDIDTADVATAGEEDGTLILFIGGGDPGTTPGSFNWYFAIYHIVSSLPCTRDGLTCLDPGLGVGDKEQGVGDQRPFDERNDV